MTLPSTREDEARRQGGESGCAILLGGATLTLGVLSLLAVTSQGVLSRLAPEPFGSALEILRFYWAAASIFLMPPVLLLEALFLLSISWSARWRAGWAWRIHLFSTAACAGWAALVLWRWLER